MGAEAALIGGSVATSIMQADAMEQQGRFQREQAEVNAQLMERQANDALVRGQFEAGRQEQKARAVAAAGRVAAAAAGGVKIDVGSPAEAMASTNTLGAVDSMMIKNNAYREAWGYKIEASNKRFEGQMADIGARAEARNTLLSGGISAAKSMYAYKGATTPKTTDEYTGAKPIKTRTLLPYRGD